MKCFWTFLSCVWLLSNLPCKAERFHSLLMSDGTNKMFRCEVRSLFFCAEINFPGCKILALDVYENFVYPASEVGILWRCKTDAAHTCEILTQVNSPVTALALTKDGKSVFIGHSRKIWRCDAHIHNSCFEYRPMDSAVNTLAVSPDYIYAGLENGQMWRCELNHPQDCAIFNAISDGAIIALTLTSEYVYAGITNGWMLRCGARNVHTCAIFNAAGQPIRTLDAYGGFVYAGLKDGKVWRCKDDEAHGCTVITSRTSSVNSLKVIQTSEGSDCGLNLPSDWTSVNVRNRTTYDYELNISRNKH